MDLEALGVWCQVHIFRRNDSPRWLFFRGREKLKITTRTEARRSDSYPCWGVGHEFSLSSLGFGKFEDCKVFVHGLLFGTWSVESLEILWFESTCLTRMYKASINSWYQIASNESVKVGHVGGRPPGLFYIRIYIIWRGEMKIYEHPTTRWFNSWPFYPRVTLEVTNNHLKGSQNHHPKKVTKTCQETLTLPETNSSHLKHWGWFRWVSFWGPAYFSAANC